MGRRRDNVAAKSDVAATEGEVVVDAGAIGEVDAVELGAGREVVGRRRLRRPAKGQDIVGDWEGVASPVGGVGSPATTRAAVPSRLPVG